MLALLLSTSVLFSQVFFSPGDSVSIYAVDMESGKVLCDENSQKNMNPGSTLKVVTTATALQILGPEYRFQTALEYDGSIDAGIMKGNLYIRGGGDPCLGIDAKKQIEEWVSAVQKLGIHTIEGNVIGDANRWESALAAPGWLWEDLGNYYGAGACALTFHENRYRLFFKPGSKVGDEAVILRLEPDIAGLQLVNEVKTGPVGSGDCACIYGSEYSPLQIVRGTIPAGVAEFSIKGAIPDPARFCAAQLANSLQGKGIAIQHDNMAFGNRITFHSTLSPPLKEIVFWTNQKSHNLYAEHLLKKMGEATYGEGSTLGGIQAVKSFWQAQKIDLDGLADGSGVSRKNLITARQLVAILLKMKDSEIFLKSLPEEAPGIRAKSGSMTGLVAYAGYAGQVAFAILINNSLDRQHAQEGVERLWIKGFEHDLIPAEQTPSSH
ncbi:MAG: D-alanyl-D-alanine carboxypeptidase/D-alanyl-D-alanine-endopeptidase [Parachlamydia sp.]|nr:D-alanyl-D-alanine carboxypeptidase/D-alanyl-D-alanine-endopeptidase [Parachlamydia sp.]